MKHRIAVLLGTGALLAGGLVAAPEASAAPTCLGATCNGKNPAATTCADDARTVISDYPMELRYSSSCRAAWGRFMINAPTGSKIEIKNNQGKKYTTYGSGKFYSVMVNDKDVKAWACGYWPRANVECTRDY
ncbi:DUF2690 domain-containing protein [Yinghuangia seranimata]|uniref:DUF2690 domain-containing protein n=1 Tax=Yinghuangia seranimata TaxID=408067 RepID=UPI00248D3A30|nr:DUF2690 domain-containing protein [Yinghuangia seranimata]MDI2124771.1 DUF2690 domain-containing protein [Yinghuangia seranimata]